ncbi:MAG: AMP-binding protein [Winogradskyella sp.]
MIISYHNIHNKFKLNGLYYNRQQLKTVAYNYIKEGADYEKITGHFLLNWLDDNDHIFVKTSGSTGPPKTIKLLKSAMVNSAIATGVFFNLKPSDTALHCLPTDYIAGKMMLVRALILGLEIDCVKPSTQLSFNFEKHYHFCAMIPLQVQHSLQKTKQIKTIIIGGSKVSDSLLKQIKNCNSLFYETYGMTETVTHIAVRQLQSKAAKAQRYFNALPKVKFTQDDSDCLIIEAPNVSDKLIMTNDCVDLKSQTQFQLLGRVDNVINSGGVKLFPEQIEKKLQPHIKVRFFIASTKDAHLGEKLILVIENSEASLDIIMNIISELKTLDKFEIPKKIYTLKTFIETSTGKIQRKKTLNAIFGS